MAKTNKKEVAKILQKVDLTITMMENAKKQATDGRIEWAAMEEGVLTMLHCFRFVFQAQLKERSI